MNKDLLIWTRDNLHNQLKLCRESNVSIATQLQWLMLALAAMCSALARESEE